MAKAFKWVEPTEKQIENSILDFLNVQSGCFAFKVNTTGIYDENGGFYRKLSKYVIPGTPDIICCFNGRFLGFEVKSAKGIQSIAQKEFQSRLETRSHGLYYVVRSTFEVENILKTLQIPHTI